MSVGAGAAPAGVTPDGAANFASLEAWAGATRGDWLASWTQQITNLAQQFINWETAMQQIADVADADLADMVMDAFTGIQGTIFTLFPWFQNLTQMFGGIDLSDPTSFDAGGAVETFITTMVEPLGLLLGPNSAIQAAQLIGSLPLSILSVLPVGSLTSSDQNLLTDPYYRNDGSIDEADWFWTSTPKHSPTGGSAAVELDGLTHELLSDPAIKVVPNQKLKASHWLRWAGVTHTGGNVFQLGIVFYDAAYNEIDDIAVANVANPAAASSNAPEGDFILLQGTETTAPANSAWARMRLSVLATGTAGTSYWSDAALLLTRKIQMSWVDGLLDLLNTLLPIDEFTNLLETLAGTGSGNLITAITSRLQNLTLGGLFDASGITNIGGIPALPDAKVPGLGTIADEVVKGVSGGLPFGNPLTAVSTTLTGFIDFLRQGATGTQETLATADQAGQGIAGLRESLTAVQNEVAQIRAGEDSGAGVVGTTLIDEGERTSGSGWGAGWTLVGPAGAVGIDGHNFYWIDSGNVVRTVLGIYNTGQTFSNYQKVSMVFHTLMEDAQAYTGDGPFANNIIICRGSSDLASCVYAKIFRHKVQLWRRNGGVNTQINFGGNAAGGLEQTFNAPAGARWDLVAGTATSERQFKLLCNNSQVFTWTDSGSVTAMGSSNRYAGMGMESDDRNSGEATPGSISVWTCTDNQPSGTVGTTFRASRRVTTDTTIGAGNGVAVPNSFYETVDIQSDDLTYTPGNNCAVTVLKAGTYLCSVRAYHGLYAQGSGGHAVLFKNGIIVERGMWGDTPTSFNAVASSTDATQGVFFVYCAAGDVLKPGFRFTSSMANTGDAKLSDGDESYWQVTRVNP